MNSRAANKKKLTPRHVLSTSELSDSEILHLTAPSPDNGGAHYCRPFIMSMVFCSPSTRTRLSFVRAVDSLGGTAVALEPGDLRLADGETIEDTARAISEYSDVCGVRAMRGKTNLSKTFEGLLERFSRAASIPTINMASEYAHPCQGLADLKTLKETFQSGARPEVVISWSYSPDWLRPASIICDLVQLLPRAGFPVTLLHPPGFDLPIDTLHGAYKYAKAASTSFRVCNNRQEAIGPDTLVLYARNWTSSAFDLEKPEQEQRRQQEFSDWSFKSSWLEDRAPKCSFMHCLPVHRGFEADDILVDGRKSLVQQQMGNRVEVQRRLINLLLASTDP